MLSQYLEWASSPQFPYRQFDHFGETRRQPWLVLAIAVLLHAGLLYLLLQRTNTMLVPPKPKAGETISMLYFPAPAEKKPQPKPTPRLDAVRPHATPKNTITASARPSSNNQPKLPAVAEPEAIKLPQPAEEEDMMARIDAARKRRAEQALAQAAPAEVAEDDNQRATRIARANFASVQKGNGGNEKEDNGGVFQIKNQSYHHAEFTFRGWNSTMRRMWPKQYVVEQGQENDIETAIIKKIIEVIRKEKDGDFVWESHRLGKAVTLSARIQDTAHLQQFLLREFFPNYRQVASN